MCIDTALCVYDITFLRVADGKSAFAPSLCLRSCVHPKCCVWRVRITRGKLRENAFACLWMPRIYYIGLSVRSVRQRRRRLLLASHVVDCMYDIYVYISTYRYLLAFSFFAAVVHRCFSSVWCVYIVSMARIASYKTAFLVHREHSNDIDVFNFYYHTKQILSIFLNLSNI